MKKKCLLFFLLFSISCFSQFSKIHYIPPLSGSNNIYSSAQEQYIYISTPSLLPVNFIIKELGGNVISGTVSKSVPYVYNVGFGTGTQLHVEKSLVNTILSNKGYIIEAEDLIYVSARVIAGSSNQAGALVSKGLAGLGTQFRIGSLLNTTANPYNDNHYTFISILATENNTVVQFSDIKPNAHLINDLASGNTPAPITLNSGQSYVMAVEGPWDANRDALIGALVSANKPIVVNCGSFTGSNANNNLDLGFDQIVSVERTGKDYIFIKSTGQDDVERVLLVAHDNTTEIYLNGNSGSPDYVINAGAYIALDGSNFDTQGNLYVRTNNNVFAYQTVGDNSRTDFANQELFFVPPLNCETPHVIDNIPLLEKIGNRDFQGRVTIITESGSVLNFEINGVPYSLATLNFLPGVTINGPTTVVTATQNYDTYTIAGLKGNVGVFSSSQLYLAAYGTDGAATFGGFYSGFTFKPEISFSVVNNNQNSCIPNTELTVNSTSPFDVFQWYFNDNPISGATTSMYHPLQPGYYFVKATISACGSTLISDKIPISSCSTNSDNDLANDNIDIDHDNDGISDCQESLGDLNVDLSDMTALNITTAGPNIPVVTPFSGNASGDFVTATPVGKNNSVSFQKTFAQPTSISLEYVASASAADLLTSDGQYNIIGDADKTITILNLDNQLLIDTNYDGIYESGVNRYSSFEIRFRLNSAVPLVAGTGTFKFKAANTTSITFTHTNLSDATANNATFHLIASCVPRDTDLDGIIDALDLDSDNDGIPDAIEATGSTPIALSNTDVNLDGLDDAFSALIPTDTDGDGVFDFVDLDSDNDGIYDLIESGSTASDSNLDGLIDGSLSDFGPNGFYDALETIPNSGNLNYTLADTNADAIRNYLSLDSDSDGCNDVIEADLNDGNYDGLLGNNLPIVNATGTVTNSIGYTVLPNNNYIVAAPISILTQPAMAPTCAFQNTILTIYTTPVTSYHWQVLLSGIWTDIIDDANYSQSGTNTLHINNTPFSFNGLRYRVVLQKNGNSCNLISAIATLVVYDVPTVTSPVSLVQCDNDNDGFTTVNLTQKESDITAVANTTFTYYKTFLGAKNGDETNSSFISNPTAFYTNSNVIWVRIVENIHGCFNVSELDVTVSATQIPSTFQRKFYQCDDFLDSNGNNTINNDDRDGIATFDFSMVTADITALLPTTAAFTIKYYKNFGDASMEVDASGNSLEISQNTADFNSINHYRNIGYPNLQHIWVRIESTADNSCYGLGPFITLTVEALPIAYSYNDTNIIRHCDDNQDGSYAFNTNILQQVILNGQTNGVVSYFDETGAPLPSPLPNPFLVNGSKTITVRVTNASTLAANGPCYDEETIQYIVDDLPEAFPVNSSLLNVCDEELDPLEQDGLYAFDTSTFEATILNGQTGRIVKYFDGNSNPLPSPLPDPFVTGTQNVTALVINPQNLTCPATVVLPFVVNPIPKINLSGEELVCSNTPNFFKTINAGILDNSSLTNYSFQWYRNGTLLPGETSYSIAINSQGIYAVEVTTIPQGCSRTRTITVVTSDIAHINDIRISDLSDSNSVEILAFGDGSLVYNLDSNDTFQDSNIFTNVPAGIHQVYVKDLNGCGTIGPIEIYVLGIPKFFTPDFDGFNDTWNIKGASDKFNNNALIRIYDRNGKLIKELEPTGPGWDGSYHGRQLPSEDYWYSIHLEDGRILKGHFSLNR